jgi:hypothetical protein
MVSQQQVLTVVVEDKLVEHPSAGLLPDVLVDLIRTELRVGHHVSQYFAVSIKNSTGENMLNKE